MSIQAFRRGTIYKNPILNFFIYSHLFLAGVVTAFYLGNNILLRDRLGYDGYGPYVFFSSLLLYNIHRLYGVFNQRVSLQPHYQWTASNKNIVYVIILIAAPAAAYFAIITYRQQSFILLLLTLFLGLCYTFHLLPTAKRMIRLKDIPIIKPLIISLTVIIVTLVIPQVNNYGITGIASSYFILLSVSQLLLITSLTILFDMRDTENDRENGLKTLPAVYGSKIAKNTAFVLVSFATLIVLLLWAVKLLTLVKLFAMIAAHVSTFLSIHFFNSKTLPFYYMLWVDGVLASQFLILIIYYYL